MYRTEYTEQYCFDSNSVSDSQANNNNFFNNPGGEGEQQRRKLKELYRQESLRDIQEKNSRRLRRANTERVYSPSAAVKPVRPHAVPEKQTTNLDPLRFAEQPRKSRYFDDSPITNNDKRTVFTAEAHEHADSNRPHANWSSEKHLSFREQQKSEWREALEQQIREKQQRKQQERNNRIQEDLEDNRRVQAELSQMAQRSQPNTQTPQIQAPQMQPLHIQSPQKEHQPIARVSPETTVPALRSRLIRSSTHQLSSSPKALPRLLQDYSKDLLTQETSLNALISRIKQEEVSSESQATATLTELQQLKDLAPPKSLPPMPTLRLMLPTRTQSPSASPRLLHIETSFRQIIPASKDYTEILEPSTKNTLMALDRLLDFN